jgi:hypothetical protein
MFGEKAVKILTYYLRSLNYTLSQRIKGMGEGLEQVLDNAVKIANLNKSRPANYRICQVLCEEMGVYIVC